MRMILASNNAHKAKELSAILSELGVETMTMREAGFTSDPEETGSTFAENAEIKARALFELCGEAVIADDSGLSVDALGGAPGVRSARFAGLEQNDAANNALLLEKLKDIPPEQRGARFVSAICCILPDGRMLRAEGTCPGVILDAPRGSGGFGYDPLFCIPELGMTFAELSEKQKNEISHRARALAQFAERFRSEIGAAPFQKTEGSK